MTEQLASLYVIVGLMIVMMSGLVGYVLEEMLAGPGQRAKHLRGLITGPAMLLSIYWAFKSIVWIVMWVTQ